MIINTNYPIFNTAINAAARAGIELNVIKTDSVYRLAQQGTPNIVLCEKAPDESFPHIKFVGPKCEFPNYKFDFRHGFDSQILDNTPPADIEIDVFFINKSGQKNKAFIKNLESLDFNLKVLGAGFGISQLNIDDLNDEKIAAMYNRANIIAADSIEEILKAHYLNKLCITPFNYTNSINIKNIKHKSNIDSIAVNTKDLVIKHTWQNVFNDIFELTQEEFRWK